MEATADEIIFTSCGSESNNLAIKGVASDNSWPKKDVAIIGTASLFQFINKN